MARKMKYRFTSSRRAALKKAQLRSSRKRKGLKRSDTLGYYIRKIPGLLANGATMGKASKISNLVERKDQQHARRYKKYKGRNG